MNAKVLLLAVTAASTNSVNGMFQLPTLNIASLQNNPCDAVFDAQLDILLQCVFFPWENNTSTMSSQCEMTISDLFEDVKSNSCYNPFEAFHEQYEDAYENYLESAYNETEAIVDTFSTCLETAPACGSDCANLNETAVSLRMVVESSLKSYFNYTYDENRDSRDFFEDCNGCTVGSLSSFLDGTYDKRGLLPTMFKGLDSLIEILNSGDLSEIPNISLCLVAARTRTIDLIRAFLPLIRNAINLYNAQNTYTYKFFASAERFFGSDMDAYLSLLSEGIEAFRSTSIPNAQQQLKPLIENRLTALNNNIERTAKDADVNNAGNDSTAVKASVFIVGIMSSVAFIF
eukprot:Awhi_evm1s12119